jgi:hypothetical protein
MSHQESSPPDRPISGWAVGGIAFAGSMMIINGFFQMINGLTAIINDEFFVVTPNYTFDFDVTAWGWIHLILGLIIFLGGLYLFSGNPAAIALAVVIAMVSAVANFFFIPYYPVWSLLIIAIDVWVIWAVTRPAETRA